MNNSNRLIYLIMIWCWFPGTWEIFIGHCWYLFAVHHACRLSILFFKVIKPLEKIIIYLDSGPHLSRHEVENLIWYLLTLATHIEPIYVYTLYIRCFVCESGKEQGIVVKQSEWRRRTSKVGQWLAIHIGLTNIFIILDVWHATAR